MGHDFKIVMAFFSPVVDTGVAEIMKGKFYNP